VNIYEKVQIVFFLKKTFIECCIKKSKRKKRSVELCHESGI
jgi:hypothetical protein